jgi:hypothetical protein
MCFSRDRHQLWLCIRMSQDFVEPQIDLFKGRFVVFIPVGCVFFKEVDQVPRNPNGCFRTYAEKVEIWLIRLKDANYLHGRRKFRKEHFHLQC